MTIQAPFTDTQLAGLEWWQNNSHPYTCLHRGESPHEHRYSDKGALVPRKDGLYCPDCGYLQTWALDHAGQPQSFLDALVLGGGELAATGVVADPSPTSDGGLPAPAAPPEVLATPREWLNRDRQPVTLRELSKMTTGNGEEFRLWRRDSQLFRLTITDRFEDQITVLLTPTDRRQLANFLHWC